MKQFYWSEYEVLVNQYLKTGDKLLDAGAGDTHWKQKLRDDIKYTSMDLGVGDPAVDYSHLDIKGDLEQVPLESQSIDAITCIQVLEHLPRPWIVLNEFRRVLKIGGYLFLTCPLSVPLHQEPYDFYRYTKYGLASILKDSGFEIVLIKPQKGSFFKISNDLRFAALLLLKDGRKIRAYLLKGLAKILDIFFGTIDGLYDQDTTGYFIIAKAN